MQIVSYLRVSTARQGSSGLGLEAQRAAVAGFAAAGACTVVSEFAEVESGAKNRRPQLAAALAACKLHRATLVIAKLDRLARNVAFIANLMDGGVEFVACDLPHANRLTLHLLAAIAEHEREMISQRTKAALQAAKARGVRLGNPNGAAALLDGCKTAARASAAVRQAKAARHAAAVAPIALSLAKDGLNNREIARELNRRGVPSQSGNGWYAEQVRRTLLRLQVSLAA
ncbi:recombinase family protein [Erythrobacter sp. A6_0]|uniref:recombinase family protein n=1 Tax=Erythrobacter sp. A6_0 TaxID=2821089 RepID=UPI001AD98894|nr:recombinase family protein [Erythrobacter sp. A6_0]MBO9511676.1 recombinase family protein [Erythrobacter sp. A6_0]